LHSLFVAYEVRQRRRDAGPSALRNSAVSGGGKLQKTPIHPALAEALRRLYSPPFSGTVYECGANHTVGQQSEWVMGTREQPQLGVDGFGRMIAAVSKASGVSTRSHSFRRTLTSDLFAPRSPGRSFGRHVRLVAVLGALAPLHTDLIRGDASGDPEGVPRRPRVTQSCLTLRRLEPIPWP
jgi:hypothetical protein